MPLYSDSQYIPLYSDSHKRVVTSHLQVESLTRHESDRDNDMLALDSSQVVSLCMLDTTRVHVNDVDSPHYNTGSRSLAF